MRSSLPYLAYAVPVAIVAMVAQPVRQERFGRPALEFRVRTIEVVYSDRPGGGQGAILRGEPFELDVGLVNRKNGPRAKVESDWFSGVSFTIRPGRMFDKSPAPSVAITCEEPAVIQERDVEDYGDFLVLGREGHRWVRCHLNLKGLELAAGVYTLRAEWGPNAKLKAYPDAFFIEPPSTWDFEYRDVLTEADLLDFDIHMAYRAFYDRQRSDEALAFLNDLLARRPMSAIALGQRAAVLMATGACREAVADQQRAIYALKSGADPRRKPRSIDESDDAQRITRLQESIDRAHCK
jgi:hypothetical protein